MSDDNDAAFEETESQEAFFAEMPTFIGHDLRPPIEDHGGVDEIDPMRAKVGCSLLVVPFEVNCNYKL